MNLDSDPVHCPCKYLKSETSFSVVLFARAEVEGFGASDWRASPYEALSCILTSSIVSHCVNWKLIRYVFETGTVNAYVAVAGTSQQSVAVASDNALHKSSIDVEVKPW